MTILYTRTAKKQLARLDQLVCDIQDDKILVTILRIAHRREVYRGN